MRKLLILLLAISLATAATASEWLVPAMGNQEVSAAAASTEDDAEPQLYFESLQIIQTPISGFQLQQVLPTAFVEVPTEAAARVHWCWTTALPASIILFNRLLFTHIMPSLAP
jgi:hypothetical protein